MQPNVAVAVGILTAIAAAREDSTNPAPMLESLVDAANDLSGGFEDLAQGALLVAWHLATTCAELAGDGATVAQVLEAVGPVLGDVYGG